MSLTLRFNGPPSPGYAEDGETWVDDLGTDAGYPLGRRVTAGEAVTLDGDDWTVVRQDPDDPAGWQPDAILLEHADGQRVALPRSLWSADGEPAAAVEKVADVLRRVGDDPDAARAELDAERARGDAARSTLVRDLQRVIDNAGQPAPDAGE